MAREAGYASPNYLQQVIQSMRRLGRNQAQSTAKYIGLGDEESRYLERMIAFDEAKTHNDRDLIFKEMIQMRRKRKVKSVDDAYYAFFSHWWIPVVWELCVHQNYNGDPAWIAKKIKPNITPTQVEKALEILNQLNLIESTGDSKWIRKDSILHTESEVRALAATNYHIQTLGLAKEALEKVPSQERDFRSITIGLSAQEMERIKKRLADFWKEILLEAQEDQSKDKVCHINLQFYPVSDEIKDQA